MLSQVRESGIPSDRLEHVEKGLDDIKDTLKEEFKDKFEDKFKDAGNAALGTTNAVLTAIPKFKSGEPLSITEGVFDIVGNLAEFANLGGPIGKAVGAVVSSVCSIVSAILGFFNDEVKESEEDMLNRVMKDNLEIQSHNELKSSAAGYYEGARKRIRLTANFLRHDRSRWSALDISMIGSTEFLFYGIEFLEKLKNYIDGDWLSAERRAKLLASYISLAAQRQQQLAKIALVLAMDQSINTNFTLKEAKDMHENDKKHFSWLLETPTDARSKLYSKVHLLPAPARHQIESYLGAFPGYMVRLYNTKQQGHMIAEDTEDHRSEVRVAKVKKDVDKGRNPDTLDKKEQASLFLIFLLGEDGTCKQEDAEQRSLKDWDRVLIFSLRAAGYIYAADYNPFDHDRRRINAWTPGNRVFQGYWKFTTRKGSFAIWNTHQKEYVYAADFGKNGDENRVFGWRPGNFVNQGYWDVEDVECRPNRSPLPTEFQTCN